MLNLCTFNNSRDFFENILPPIYQGGLSVKIIVPQASIADEIRLKLNSSLAQVDVVTIASFSKDLLEKKFNKNILRKVDLLKILSLTWKRIHGAQDFNFFLSAFKLFTELRSYSLNADLILPALEESDAKLQAAILSFYKIMEMLDLVDEQKAYALLSDDWRSNKDEYAYPWEKENIFIFYGFQNLSAFQVDLLKSLALRTQVYVPLPESVYVKSVSSDWISWLTLKKEQVNLTVLEKETLQVVSFSHGQLPSTIERLIQEKFKDKPVTCYLGLSKLEEDIIFDIPIQNAFFKNATSLFVEEIEWLVSYLESFLLQKNNSVAQIKKRIEEKIKEELKLKELKSFRKIKLGAKFLNILQDWSDESSLTLFDISLIREILMLTDERIYQIPIYEKQSQVIFHALENLQVTKVGDAVIVCATSDYPALTQGQGILSSFMESVLVNLGPLRRSELQLEFLKFKLKSTQGENTFFVIEDTLLAHDVTWNEILGENYKEVKLNTAIPKSDVKNHNFLSNWVSLRETTAVFSATKLQSYLDCPRKFYFQYVNPLSPTVEWESFLEARELGEIQHELLAQVIKEDLKEQTIDEHIEHFYKSYLARKSKKVSGHDYERYLVEISTYVKHGWSFLKYFKTKDSQAQFIFEENLCLSAEVSYQVKGRIDCIILGSFGAVLLDFKRSKASIPTQADIKNYQKIQLLFYQHYFPFQNTEIILWGYLNLGEIKESLLFTKNNFFQEIETEFEIKLIQDNFSLEDYELYEQEIRQAITQEILFPAKPRKNNVCDFCSLFNVCDKGSSA
ncbi:MAG: PD-(D/E)XK nuclease family protein [Bacteriovoracaceae bacterium]|nr:PD-(D/E)XK nuclease family protein [Bacteriovoracaceae bacterium]